MDIFTKLPLKLIPKDFRSKWLAELAERERLQELWNSKRPSDVLGPKVDFSSMLSSSPDIGPEMRRLYEKIQTLGYSIPDWKYQIAVPVVSLEDFFDDNDEEHSLATNLEPHPGLNFFKRKLLQIRKRPDVQDVLFDIYHVSEPPTQHVTWPGPESVYIITTAEEAKVDEWNRQLLADGPSEGWLNDIVPNGAPIVLPGYRVWRIMWD